MRMEENKQGKCFKLKRINVELTWQNFPILGEMVSLLSPVSERKLASTALVVPHWPAPKQHHCSTVPQCAAMTPAPNRARNRAQPVSTSPFPFHDGCWLKHPLHFMRVLVTFCPAVLPLPLHSISMSSALVAAFHFILLLFPLPVTVPPQLPHPPL